jgi:hypothetical protein
MSCSLTQYFDNAAEGILQCGNVLVNNNNVLFYKFSGVPFNFKNYNYYISNGNKLCFEIIFLNVLAVRGLTEILQTEKADFKLNLCP